MHKCYSKIISLIILIAFIFTQAGLGTAMPIRHTEPVPRSQTQYLNRPVLRSISEGGSCEGGNLRKPQDDAKANGYIDRALASKVDTEGHEARAIGSQKILDRLEELRVEGGHKVSIIDVAGNRFDDLSIFVLDSSSGPGNYIEWANAWEPTRLPLVEFFHPRGDMIIRLISDLRAVGYKEEVDLDYAELERKKNAKLAAMTSDEIQQRISEINSAYTAVKDAKEAKEALLDTFRRSHQYTFRMIDAYNLRMQALEMEKVELERLYSVKEDNQLEFPFKWVSEVVSVPSAGNGTKARADGGGARVNRAEGVAKANANSKHSIDYEQVFSELRNRVNRAETENKEALTRLLDVLNIIYDQYIVKEYFDQDIKNSLKEAIDSILVILLRVKEEGFRDISLNSSLTTVVERTHRIIELKSPGSIVGHELRLIKDRLINIIGTDKEKKEKKRRQTQQEEEYRNDAVGLLKNGEPGSVDREEKSNILAAIRYLGWERFNTPESQAQLHRWYSEATDPLVKIYAWWALYRIGIEAEPPQLTSENGVVCSLENFQPVTAEADEMEIPYNADMLQLFDFMDKYPWFTYVYLVKVKTEVVESLLSEEMIQRKHEISDKISWQIVSKADAKMLSEQGREITAMLVPRSYMHGRQVFWVDEHGNWYGLKGIGNVNASFNTESVQAWKKPEDSRNAGTGLAEVDHEDAPGYTRELRQAGLELKEAGIGNSELAAAARYLELWDAQEKRFVDAAEFDDWRIPIVDENGQPELDENGQPTMVKFVPGIHLIYYGKEARRIGEYTALKDEPVYQDFIRLSIARKYGLDFPDNKRYIQWLSYKVGENLAKLINSGKAHYYLNAHNILVDGSFVDMESMQNLGDVSMEEAVKLTNRDINYAIGSITSSFKEYVDILQPFVMYYLYNGLVENINPDKECLLSDDIKKNAEQAVSMRAIIDIFRARKKQAFARAAARGADGGEVTEKQKEITIYLEGLGVRNLGHVIEVFPSILGYSIEQNLKPTVAYLEGLGVRNLGHVIEVFPQILGCSIEQNLKPTVAILEQIRGDSQIDVAELRSLLIRNPKVLGLIVRLNRITTVRAVVKLYNAVNRQIKKETGLTAAKWIKTAELATAAERIQEIIDGKVPSRQGNGEPSRAAARGADAGGAAAKAAGVKILAIVEDEVSARTQIQQLLNEGYQPSTDGPITMDNIRFYQLPPEWTQADIEREAQGTHAVILNVDGLGLQEDLIRILRDLGLPFAEVKENNWREALEAV